jgi:KaiC/GvpD/RAD55 family RecA-like ATPase
MVTGRPSEIKAILYGPYYVRLCKTVRTPGTLVKLDEIENELNRKELIKSAPNSDWYTSLYYYPQEAFNYYKKNGSIGGYKGPAFTKKLIFDFDSKQDVELARKDAIQLLERLQNLGVDVANSCRVFFSGSKGFHIEILTNKEFTPEQLKPLCENLAADLPTFDTSIYNTTRLIRLMNTQHQETGLFKIELLPDDLITKSLVEIKSLATKPVSMPDFVLKPVEDLSFLDKFKKQEKKPIVYSGSEDIRGLDNIDFSKMPKGMPRCIYALSHGIMKSGEGERNHLFLRLASYYRNQGLTKEVCLHTLLGIAKENHKLYPEFNLFTEDELRNTVITSVYSDKWKQIPDAAGTDESNELLKRYCNAAAKKTERPCCLHNKVDNNQKVVQISDVFDKFSNFAQNFDRNTVKTGIGFIDDHMNIAVGTTTLLVGSSGSGKTTLGLNVMENANALGQHTMFFSLDMHMNLVYLKLAQKITNYSQQELLDIFKTRDKMKMAIIKDQIAEKYGKTYFDFSSILSLDQMRDKLFDIEQKTGNKIKLVMVDYAGRIDGPKSDVYANANYNALKSVETANVTDAAWIIISQISRQTGDGCTPIRTKRAAKDSGAWEESASNVITCWRPFMGDVERDEVMRLFLAKNRMGKEIEDVLHWDGAKGVIRDMSPEEKAIYNEMVGPEAEKLFLKERYAAKSGGTLTST